MIDLSYLNIYNKSNLNEKEQMKMMEVYDFHRKMYDARWNGEKDLYVTFRQLEDEFLSVASKANLSYEKINEMLEQLYIPPYQYNRLPEHLKHAQATKSEMDRKVGRPSLGLTKKVSVTLPHDIWQKIEKEIEKDELQSMSAYFRKFVLDYFKDLR
jgi:hypothetical protein